MNPILAGIITFIIVIVFLFSLLKKAGAKTKTAIIILIAGLVFLIYSVFKN